MKNREFKIDTESGVIVFCQESHGKKFISKTKVDDSDRFNVGIGQLIAMKRNEIAIRKHDIQAMKKVAEECKYKIDEYKGTTGSKMYASFAQITCNKIAMSYNHIRELKRDLQSLYEGNYDVKPYDKIVAEHRSIRNGGFEKEELLKKPYSIPKEIIEGTHIFDIVDGSVTIKKL